MVADRSYGAGRTEPGARHASPVVQSPTASRTKIVPIRACARCDHVDDVFHLTMVGRVWLCGDCHGRLRYPESTDEPFVSSAALSAAELRRIDATLRWLGTAARFVVYAALVLWSLSSPLVAAALLGLFIADAGSWVVQAWFDAHFHRGAVTSEAVLFSITFVVMLECGAFTLPTDFSARSVAVGVAGAVLAVKGMRLWWKLNFRSAGW